MDDPLTASKMRIQIHDPRETKDMAERPTIYKKKHRKSRHKYRMKAYTKTKKSEEGFVTE
jgi:hypothetical protein